MAVGPLTAPGQLHGFGQGAQLGASPAPSGAVADVEQQMHGGGIAVPFRGVDGFDVGVSGGDRRGDGRQHSAPVGDIQSQFRAEVGVDVRSHSTSIHFSGFCDSR
jgi:hypothetical protein